jgi:hypothetical protein
LTNSFVGTILEQIYIPDGEADIFEKGEYNG